jgi:alkyl hydroperoxide reductase 1
MPHSNMFSLDLPSYIENLKALKAKGVDQVACIASNDAFVMSAWGKANGVQGNDIVSLSTFRVPKLSTNEHYQLFLSDPDLKFSKSIGWLRGADRTERYAIVIDHGKVIYAAVEPGKDVTVSLPRSDEECDSTDLGVLGFRSASRSC